MINQQRSSAMIMLCDVDSTVDTAQLLRGRELWPDQPSGRASVASRFPTSSRAMLGGVWQAVSIDGEEAEVGST
jgi:hypothetical protein